MYNTVEMKEVAWQWGKNGLLPAAVSVTGRMDSAQ